MDSKRYGLILDPIVADKDFQFGGYGALDGLILQPTGQWHQYLPPPETQLNYGVDAQACVTFGTLNAVEILLRRIYTNQLDNFSDRFLATISGTTERGNSPQTVAEALRKQGVVREAVWPITPDLNSWERFYSDVPTDVKTLAEEFRAKFDFKHEYVTPTPQQLKAALKYGPVGVSVSAWQRNDKGLYVSPFPNNHWVVLIGYKDAEYWEVFDSYREDGVFLKRLAWNHEFSQAKRYRILVKVDIRSKGWWDFVIGLLKHAFGINVATPPPVATSPAPSLPAKIDYITPFAEAIKLFEGWAAPGERDRTGRIHPSGSASWRRNNPGNIKNINGDFISYPTYAAGWSALLDYLERACTGRHTAYKPSMTIREFFAVYSPDGPSIETAYTNFVCQHISTQVAKQIFPSTHLRELV